MLHRVGSELANCLDRLATTQANAVGQLPSYAISAQHKSFGLAEFMSGNAPVTPARFFTSKEQEYSVMLPFMAEGFEAGDRLT